MRLLDLFSGAGGAAMGYHEAGFDEIVGVDIVPQPRYPFTFIQGDALEYVRHHGHEFDAIHSSPPCQGYNSLHKVNGRLHGKRYPDLIAATRKALQATGKPYVIENVVDAKKHLIDPVMLCGTFFGLKVYRHRLFECNPSLSRLQPKHVPHDDRSPGCNGNRTSPKGYITVCGGKGGGFRIEPASKAMGINWMIRRELAQAIPPAYTRWIGRHLLEAMESLQPTESDVGKEIYVDQVEKRGVFLGGIHQRMIAGTSITLAVVQFPGCASKSVFPLEELELIPEEKTTAQAVAKHTKSTGEYIMGVTNPQSVLGELINLHKETEVVAISDLDELKKLESEIKNIQESAWVEIGRRLSRIKEAELWKADKYTSWDTYCRDRWKLAKSTANEMIAGVKVLEEVDVSASSLPLSKNATKPLAKMLNSGKKPEQVQEFIQGLAQSKPGQELSKEVIEEAAIERGLLPKKTVKPIVAQAQSVGLSGKESQQLPTTPTNADIAPIELPKQLIECNSAMEIREYCQRHTKQAIAQLKELTWEERFELRDMCKNFEHLLMGVVIEQGIVADGILNLLDRDKDCKLQWQATEIVRLMRENDELRQQLTAVKIKPESTRTDEWYTPSEYIEMARQVMGTIDLDPASNELAQSWIKATKYFTKDDDGLRQDWWLNDTPVSVWCNPPYGRTVEDWLELALMGYQDGNIKSAILLLNRTGAAWYKKRVKEVTAICEVHKRIAFLDEDGNRQDSPRYYNDFLYLGEDVDKFIEVFSVIGDVRVMKQSDRMAA